MELAEILENDIQKLLLPTRPRRVPKRAPFSSFPTSLR